jgi:hypothetical protein
MMPDKEFMSLIYKELLDFEEVLSAKKEGPPKMKVFL